MRTYKRSQDRIVILAKCLHGLADTHTYCDKASGSDSEDESENKEFKTATLETDMSPNLNRNRSHA